MLGGDLDRMEWSSDGAEVIGYTEGGAVHWWEAATGRRRASMPPLIVKAVPIYGQRRTRVFWSPDRQLAATSLVDGSVTLWARLANLDAGYPMNGRVLALAWGPGERLAVGSDGGVVIVDLRADGREVAHLTTGWNWVWTLAWRPDGGQLALAGDHDEAAIWDVCTGEKARALRGHSAWVRSVAWSPDGESVATGSNDESIRLWRVGPADRRAGPGPNLAAASPVGVVLRGHYGAVRSLAWSPSGQWLASGSDDWTVRLWNVAAAGTAPVGALDGPAELVAPGVAESGRTLPGPGQPVRSVAWSPGGDYLAAAGGDGTVWRFDVRAGFEVRTFDSAAGPTESVAWLGPHTLVAGYRDGFIAAWDARSGNELLPRRLDCRLRALASNGTRLAAGGEAGGVGLGEPGPVRSA
jgi:WD40 repeat protein